MKRKLLLAVITVIVASGHVMGQNWMKIDCDSKDVQGIPFQKVRIKKGETKELIFTKDYQVTLSEKPDGIESGYYIVHARNGYIADGDKKNKIEIGDERMTRQDGGWYEYDFGKTLYIRKIGIFVGRQEISGPSTPIYILPINDSNAGNNAKMESINESNGNLQTEETPKSENADTTGETLEPEVKQIDYSQLENEGFKLTRSSIIDGIKCDHYEKGESKLRIFKKENGEYLVDNEDEFGFDRVPKTKSFLAFRINLPLRKQTLTFNAGDALLEFPTGIRVGLSLEGGFDWDAFKNTDKITLNHKAGNYILLPDNPNKYKWIGYPGDVDRFWGFYLINDCVYQVDEYGNLHRRAQRFGDYFYYVNSTDSIVDVQITSRRHDIKYVNGDSLTIISKEMEPKKGSIVEFVMVYTRSLDYLYDGGVTGKIHRNGGILEFKSGQHQEFIMTNPDGSKCRIFSFKNKLAQRWHIPYLMGELLVEDVLELSDYVHYFPDGREIVYKNGVSEEERKKKKKAKEKAQEEQIKAAIKALNDKYGEKYVEAALSGKPIVGMPEDLLCSAFKTELIRESGRSKVYRIKGSGLIDGWGAITISSNLTLCYVWVTAGRVSNITY